MSTPLDRRDVLALSAALASGGLLSGCLDAVPGTGPPEPALVAADRQRSANPSVSSDHRERLVAGNTAFALALHRRLVSESPESNVLTSPYSVSLALAMTWAGARGTTEREMREALRFRLDQDRLHRAFNAVDRVVDGGGRAAEGEGRPFELRTTNALWGQTDYPFREAFLDTLARQYGAGVHTVDFAENPGPARRAINAWVAEETEGEIRRLLPEGTVTRRTRFVLTNATLFDADWEHTFRRERTDAGEFTALDGSTSEVPLMRQSERFPYAEVDGHQAVELPYVGGDVGMVVVLPAAGEFAAFERSLDVDRLTTLVESLAEREGRLVLPKFAVETSFSLPDALGALGMPSAFAPGVADFSGVADVEDLFLSAVEHRCRVAVDERGTEAAAATGVVGSAVSAPADPFEMVVDRPFLYAIRERETGTVLFLGRMVAPA